MMELGAKTGPRVCVVGAGPCGLTTIKNLIAAGVGNVVCYDERDGIGGNWVFTETYGRSSVYETTHLISSRRHTEFEDFPMPPDYPDYPAHWQMRAYFDAYARHFDLLRFVRLQTRVEAAQLGPDGKWRLRISAPQEKSEEVFDYLIVCSGHHHTPLLPKCAGHFDGETLHSVEYKRAAPLPVSVSLSSAAATQPAISRPKYPVWRHERLSACGGATTCSRSAF